MQSRQTITPDPAARDLKIRLLVPGCLGFFTLVAQSLLFRDFLTIFEGNELGIALFFFSWLLWVAGGALAGRSRQLAGPRLLKLFEFLLLLYLPAYLIQQLIISHVRQLAGVPVFELFSFPRMIPPALFACAPVSLLTGLLFALACRWLPMPARGEAPAAARGSVTTVYIAESLGSACGGVFVTLLLAARLAGQTVFLLAGFVTASVVLVLQIKKRARLPLLAALGVVLLTAGLLLSGTGARWQRAQADRLWQQQIGADTCEGTFTTPQARYLYGRYADQFTVMAWGSICETFPDSEYGGEIAALNLVQHPAASRILVIGQGALAVCSSLLPLPQVTQVTWLSQDPAYCQAVIARLPAGDARALSGLEIPATAIHAFLEHNPTLYDLIIVHLPDPVTRVISSYFTTAFYKQLKRHLAPNGVVGVRISGGDNWLGEALSGLGASVYVTLAESFARIVLKPGAQSWLLASNGRNQLTSQPAALAGRVRQIDNLAAVYKGEAILKLYEPERIQAQLDIYQQVIRRETPAALLNTEQRPKALFYSLVQVFLQAGDFPALYRTLQLLQTQGPRLCLVILLSCGLLWLLYRLKGRRHSLAGGQAETGTGSAGSNGSSGSYFLVFSGGWVALSANILLLYRYQTAYGSVFLRIGLLAALFMFGLFCGSLAAGRLLAIRKPEPRWLLPMLLGLTNILLLTAALSRPAQLLSILLFWLCGCCYGGFMPLAAVRLRQQGLAEQQTGSTLELLDHAGGAAGAVMTGLFLLPVMGLLPAALLIGLLLLLNLIPLVSRGQARQPAAGRLQPRPGKAARFTRPAAWVLSGIALCLLTTAIWLHYAGRIPAPTADDNLSQAARALTQGRQPEKRTIRLATGKEFTYYTGQEAAGSFFIFSSALFAPGIYGYGGPLELAVKIDRAGTLLDFRVLESFETPRYLSYVLNRLQNPATGILGLDLLADRAFAGVDAIGGATLTSSAILRILTRAAREFHSQVLGQLPAAATPQPVNDLSLWPYICLLAMLGLTILLRRHPGRWLRRGYLLLVVIFAGFLLNLQYSSLHMFALFLPDRLNLSLNPMLLLVTGIPLLVLLLGNIFCGYLCPFGALQELIGDLKPGFPQGRADRRFHPLVSRAKYLLLFFLLVVFALRLDVFLMQPDPLQQIFSPDKSTAGWVILCLTLLLSFFYKRFWCRNLCPVGAFLSLLNRVKLLRKMMPKIIPGSCDLGIRHSRQPDCLCCDRCRAAPAKTPPAAERPDKPAFPKLNRGIHAAAVIMLLLGIIFLVSFWPARQPGAAEQAAAAGRSLHATVDDTNLQRLQMLINSGKLSGHEAMYYEVMEE